MSSLCGSSGKDVIVASEEDKKRYFLLILMGIIILALVIAIFAPRALAQSDTGNTGTGTTGFSYTRLQTSIDQCNAQVNSMRTLVDDTSKNCIVSTDRINHLADGIKFYNAGLLGLSVAINAGLTHYILRKRREAASKSTQEVGKIA